MNVLLLSITTRIECFSTNKVVWLDLTGVYKEMNTHHETHSARRAIMTADTLISKKAR